MGLSVQKQARILHAVREAERTTSYWPALPESLLCRVLREVRQACRFRWKSDSRMPTQFASLMIVAGVNAKALSKYPGTPSVVITLDRYGHLMPGMRRRRQGCWMRTGVRDRLGC